jgi:hypothetical protein
MGMLKCCALLPIVSLAALWAAQDPQHGLIVRSTSRLVQVWPGSMDQVAVHDTPNYKLLFPFGFSLTY